ncbi:MAG: hypothetical protein HOV80_19560 [Polyangiaceae bacterium]|nr:hypothetical protein [Polyangiaceae bacterium]
MDQTFSSGFFTAFAVLYAAAGVYCVWSAQRKRAEAGTLELGAVFGLLVLDSGIEGLLSLEPRLTPVIAVLREPVDALAPVSVLAFVVAQQNAPTRRLWPVFAGMLAIGIAASIESAQASPEVPTTGPARILLAVVGAAIALMATYRVLRAFLSAHSPGTVVLLGSCALSVALIHDAVSAIRGGTILGPFGYTAFTFAIFGGSVVTFTLRRDRLVEKTSELAEKSEALTRSFRELRAAQSELVRKEQLAAIGELSAVVAHEVRNPLAVITNAVATLRRTGTSEENREVLLEILSEETARLNQLVGDLLHYARPLSIERESVNVREVIDKAIVPLNSRANVVTRITEPVPAKRVRADPLLLRQAIENVVNNAVQAMSSGGVLSVDITNSEKDTGVELVFRDTGEGMDTVVRSRALDPFFTTRPSGTGLGLAIVARVVDAHGGRLRILSEPDLGTEVRIFLPSEPEPLPPVRSRLLPPIIEPFSTPGKTERKTG